MNVKAIPLTIVLLAIAVALHVAWLVFGSNLSAPTTYVVFAAVVGLAVTGGRFRWYNIAFRVLIGIELLGSVADRFGLFGGPGASGVSWGSFAEFTGYVRTLLPDSLGDLDSIVAVAATAAELILGVALVVGIFRSATYLATFVLLTGFSVAMLTSLGWSETLAYAVIPQAAALLVLFARVSTGNAVGDNRSARASTEVTNAAESSRQGSAG